MFGSLTTGLHQDEIEAYLFLDKVYFSSTGENTINLESYREYLTEQVIKLLQTSITDKQIKIIDKIKFVNAE